MIPIVQMHCVWRGKELVMRSRRRETVLLPQDWMDKLEESFFASKWFI